MNLVIPYVGPVFQDGSDRRHLRPETKAFGERLGARLVYMPGVTSYWDLVTELWAADDDFILLEEDVLPTETMIQSMWACTEPWCSGSFGSRTDIGAGLSCVKFGSIRRRIPNMMARAESDFPKHEWWFLFRGLFKVLYDEECLSPCVHSPAMVHLSKPWQYQPG